MKKWLDDIVNSLTEMILHACLLQFYVVHVHFWLQNVMELMTYIT